jgi:Zn-dependent protease with chaperone function
MDYSRLRDPHEVPLYVFSVLVNLLIIALILVGALLLGFLNALAGDPLSGPAVEVIRVAFVALLLLVPGLVFYRQLTRAGTRGSAVRLSRRQFPDIYSLKEDFARRLELSRDPEIYLMSGNGTLNAFAASTFGYDFVVIHSELFSNTYEKNKEALAFIIGHELGHLRLGHTRL